LRSVKIFQLLQGIIADCGQYVALKASKTPLKDVSVIAKSDKVKDAEAEEVLRVEKEEREESERQRRLSLSAWTAFRLLATRCVNMSENEEEEEISAASGSEALRDIQVQIFDLMCAELKTISHKMAIYHKTNNSEHCFELLVLLGLLGGSAKGYKSLSKEENISNLISILKSKNIEPRAKRLALRLCSKLLPNQSAEYIPKLIDFFLEEIGSCFYGPALQTEVAVTNQDQGNEPTAMEEESQDEDDESDEEADIEDEQYSVYLNHWNQGHQRLMEVCQNSLGFDALVPGSADRHGIESRARQILQEVTDDGRSLLKTTTLQNCNLLATSVASCGGTVSVFPVQIVNGDGRPGQSRNHKKMARRVNPTPWVSGHVAQSLAAMHIHAVRLLLQPASSSGVWVHHVQAILRDVLSKIPSLFSSDTPKDNHRLSLKVLATLAVVGGHTETLRVGGRVEENLTKKRGTIISAPGGLVHVIFDNDTSRVPRKVSPSEVKPVTELEFDGKAFLLDDRSLEMIMMLIRTTTAPSSMPSWLFADLRARAVKSLEKLLSQPESASILLKNNDNVSGLMKLANAANPSSKVHSMEKASIALVEKLWDDLTKPTVDQEDCKVNTSSFCKMFLVLRSCMMSEYLCSSGQDNVWLTALLPSRIQSGVAPHLLVR